MITKAARLFEPEQYILELTQEDTNLMLARHAEKVKAHQSTLIRKYWLATIKGILSKKPNVSVATRQLFS